MVTFFSSSAEKLTWGQLFVAVVDPDFTWDLWQLKLWLVADVAVIKLCVKVVISCTYSYKLISISIFLIWLTIDKCSQFWFRGF